MSQYYNESYVVTVASTAYNLAGDMDLRPNFLKSTIFSGVMIPRGSIAETINSSYLNGPGVKMSNYGAWCQQEISRPLYDQIMGLPVYDPIPIQDYLQSITGDIYVTVDWFEVKEWDQGNFAYEWLANNQPAMLENEWVSEYKNGEITITFPSLPAYVYTFIPTITPDIGIRYLYASYFSADPTGISINKMFIYQIGTGIPSLDLMVVTATLPARAYFPVLPVRIDGDFVSPDGPYAGWYDISRKGYKKMLGAKLDDLMDQIEEGAEESDEESGATEPSIDDMDYIYVVPGVSLNSKTVQGQLYLYKYFESLFHRQMVNEVIYRGYNNSSTGTGAYPTYETRQGEYENWMALYRQALEEGVDPPPQPLRASRPAPPTNRVSFRMGAHFYGMDMSWKYITRTVHTGLSKPGAKVGEAWVQKGAAGSVTIVDQVGKSRVASEDIVDFFFQESETSYIKVSVVGLTHLNIVNSGRGVMIGAHAALDEVDAESGFIVPLHIDTFRDLQMVPRTQLAMEATYIVINTYEARKKKWYEKGFFKAAMIIAAIIITVMTGGVSAAGVGLLGANAAVGVALGFAGLSAVVAGVLANMLAAMLVMKLITAASVELLGEEIGAIVGAVLGTLTVAIGSGMIDGKTFTDAFMDIFNPLTLGYLSLSAVNGYSQSLQLQAADYMRQTTEVLDDYKKQSREILEKSKEMFGTSDLQFDPLGLTEVFQNAYETRDSFLARTLLTGMDVAELCNDAITQFPSVTISTKLP